MSQILRADRRVPVGARRLVWAALPVAAACDAPMQIFSDASDAAARTTHLTWFMVIVAAVVYAIVMGVMVVAMTRNRGRAPTSLDVSDPGIRWIVIGGLVMPAIVLAAVFMVAETAMGKYPGPRPALTLRVTGHQWWWEVEYDLPDAMNRFKTANEIHIPAGRPVRLILTSADVIHSFWVPQLQGKLDLIPGDTNDLRLMARRPGRYRGICQEFCGAQHANMGLVVFADDSASFAQWLAGQIAEAHPPADSMELVGQRLVVGGPCALCHTIRGTSALGQVAPDLTHVGSRSTIAAARLPNTLGNLEAWIANAQALKPGVKMPTLTLYDGAQLRAVASYIASLK
jgi:cytochrome c oxidase subunit 2